MSIAKREALETRLNVFKDSALSVLAANRVMNHAALIAVMTATEKFIETGKGAQANDHEKRQW